MKPSFKLLAFVLILLIFNCKETPKKEPTKIKIQSQKTEQANTKKTDVVKASTTIDLVSKGFGPIKSMTLNSEVDTAMATKGGELFKKMCTACHRVGKKYIGPDPSGITKRRSPEWIMNMILNPEEMISKDPLAKKLLIEFNSAPMANQNLTEDEARSVLEYFRTLN